MSEWIKCDVCPAQAMHLVRGTTGELTFCGHHYNKDKEALDKWRGDGGRASHWVFFKRFQ